ncbi:MAG TPA: acyltransferase [Tahibacter sp.]|uniref:acyltransferase n=1 Tax=Tahibacter sp. TaxID=2056211 RepID=UPI002CA2E83D|nr:acyltransferase [Tahibacter sp.]HSX62955.1 acyltransferase [Tahibacter sp.]
MLRSLPAPLRAGVAFLFVGTSTALHAAPLLALALLKAALPFASWRRRIGIWLVAIAQQWVGFNSRLIRLAGTQVHVHGDVADLQRVGWYLVVCNHQSWVDIPLLQLVFAERIPMLKFFLKRELIFVPVLGLAWWALDFPFMRRYSRAELERRPELRGKDLEATQRACAKFRELPVSVMNFVEGTRFTPAKHAQQKSPYANLLLPRAGGVAFVIQAMRPLLRTLVDVTLVYPQGRPTLYDFLAGRVRDVRVHVRRLDIPEEFGLGDYENDAAFRARVQEWMNALWRDKDARIAALMS